MRVALPLACVRAALAAVCSESPLVWRGPQLSPSLPPYGDAAQLLTPWGEALDAARALTEEHPNPTQARARWCSLNGGWELDRFARDLDAPPAASAGAAGALPETSCRSRSSRRSRACAT